MALSSSVGIGLGMAINLMISKIIFILASVCAGFVFYSAYSQMLDRVLEKGEKKMIKVVSFFIGAIAVYGSSFIPAL